MGEQQFIVNTTRIVVAEVRNVTARALTAVAITWMDAAHKNQKLSLLLATGTVLGKEKFFSVTRC